MARTFIPIRPWGVTGAAALVTALFAAGAAAEDAVDVTPEKDKDKS